MKVIILLLIVTYLFGFINANGSMKKSCPTGKSLCSSHCTDLKNDCENCGTCNHKCPNGSKCNNGVCVCKDKKVDKIYVKQSLCNGKCITACQTGSHFNSTCGCCPDVCSAVGAPMWSNSIQPGGNGIFITNATTPAACCLACYNDSNCMQWAFISSSCQHNVPPSTCVGSLVNFTQGGGRCNSQLNNCFPPSLKKRMVSVTGAVFSTPTSVVFGYF